MAKWWMRTVNFYRNLSRPQKVALAFCRKQIKRKRKEDDVTNVNSGSKIHAPFSYTFFIIVFYFFNELLHVIFLGYNLATLT